MAARKTTKAATKAADDTKENTVEGITFEIVEELPSAQRGGRKSWFTEVADKIREQEPTTSAGEPAWVKVREYDSISSCRSAASGSLKTNYPDFKFSTRKVDGERGELYARLNA